MKEMDKKMKRYIRAVKRRLNLPKDIKERVISDFTSSIHVRLESGMTEAEIYEELGCAEKAAAELNKQMQAFTYRKSPWRFLFAVMAAYGAAQLIEEAISAVIVLWMRGHLSAAGEAASVGIIGGADGPTAIFITTRIEPLPSDLIALILLAVGIWGFLRLRRCRHKD